MTVPDVWCLPASCWPGRSQKPSKHYRLLLLLLVAHQNLMVRPYCWRHWICWLVTGEQKDESRVEMKAFSIMASLPGSRKRYVGCQANKTNYNITQMLTVKLKYQARCITSALVAWLSWGKPVAIQLDTRPVPQDGIYTGFCKLAKNPWSGWYMPYGGI